MNRTHNASHESGWSALFLAWLISLVASGGALFVGEIMGQAPCILCWYQRVFMFPLAVILAIAALSADNGIWRYALPLALGGLSIAGYHVLLYYGLIPEGIVPCGQGPSCADAKMTVFGWVPLPVLSFAAFAAITILLHAIRRNTSK
ncbi:disulfide bond formation protein B [Shinella sp. CPCC 100929]|jgi:disulfide bond formation protein DsbB|uniref:Disulfide bond formation protein B n=1 Tax=Shinella lacus TaxID=2654216 RepID=A0ABT1RE36_9HYPH|nr:disulfide bond formation protein B [Shinella lacus]MCQ4633440.1 disulfide bond formation protein B [Shinella lacus]